MHDTLLKERTHTLRERRSWDRPVVGLMMRRDWTGELCERSPQLELDWLEVFPENYMGRGAAAMADLERLAERWPIVSHGVHLSIGNDAGLDDRYLGALDEFLEHVHAPWCSDHLGVSIACGEVLHEILPLPFNEQVAAEVALRADAVQARTGRRFLLENGSYYLVPPGSQLDEASLWSAIFSRCEAGWLLDVNNLWVNAMNHGYDPVDFLNRVPLERVVEIHVGGFTVDAPSGLLIDSHQAAPSTPVWSLLADVLARTGPRPVLLEWEGHYPNLDAVLDELEHIRSAWELAREARRDCA